MDSEASVFVMMNRPECAGIATGASTMAAVPTRRSTPRQTHPVRRLRRRKTRPVSNTARVLGAAILVGSVPLVQAQSCISLSGSSQCPAFNASSISTDSTLVGLFPFLTSVTDLSSFDSGLEAYTSGAYAQTKYSTLLGCSDFNADNTTAFYARYTTSVICNAIIQNSITPCALSGDASRPLCAASCATFAESEEEITASNICGTSNSDALTQIRADFTNCALPSNSLTDTCIEAVANQPDDCGYETNLGLLCSYCAASSPNATDSCCVFSNTTSRCNGVVLPVVAANSLGAVTITAMATATGTASTASTASTGTAGTGAVTGARRGLTGGQIAGVVVGAILGALLLLGLIIGGCLLARRRRDTSPATSIFNQPATSRGVQPPPPMSHAFHDGARDQERAGMAVMPGGRVTRMSALEGGRDYVPLGSAHGGQFDESPQSRDMLAVVPPPKRSGSLSSGSQLAAFQTAGQDPLDTSPSTQADYTSPESQGAHASEQLGFFKDYYSQDEIRSGDVVSTLWAYEPRAADEFHLERGDMIKVLGIWDDGWATGVRIRGKAEEYGQTRTGSRRQRDSGMSEGSMSNSDSSPEEGAEVKAFPLVCVCLPQHWRKTVDGDTTDTS